MSAPYRIGHGVYEETHPRLEIRELYKKREQFSLFILAWDLIRTADYQPVPARYEEIGGIHGMPYTRWPGDPYDKITKEGGEWLGYCNHDSILFPNWHRPYIMLLEQSINQAAQEIAGRFASQFPEVAANWLNAARELRFPFWDWTLPVTGEEGLPEILYTPKLKLLGPEGSDFEHDNILAFYRFHSTIDGFNDRLEPRNAMHTKPEEQVISYYKQWKRTFRWPDSTPTNTRENIDGLNRELKDKDKNHRGSWRNLARDVASFFNFPLDIKPELYANAWDEFSNRTFQSARHDAKGKAHSPYVWNCAPLEQPHDRIHLVVGGSGHMSDNDTAGFDPIFYLHHCNVDRLWTFWAQVYPDYVAGTDGYLDVDGIERRPFVQSGGTFAESSDEVVDDNTPLLPFRKNDNKYWTSQDTQFTNNSDFRQKYYTYPDIAGVCLDTGSKLPIEERTKQLASLQKYFGFDPVQVRQAVPQIKQRLFTHTANHALREGYEPVYNYRHFVITASLSATALSGSYIVKVSLSTANELVTIGEVAVLGRGNSSRCENCQRRASAGSRIRGVITVPHDVISSFIEAEQLNAEHIETKDLIAAFKNHLRASIVLPSGKVHAETSQTSPASHDQLLSDASVPFLELHSANVASLKDEADGHDTDVPQNKSPRTPYEFYDWKSHEAALTGYWTKLGGGN